MIGALPAVHELAEQAGIELPAALGKLSNGGRLGVPIVPTGGAAVVDGAGVDARGAADADPVGGGGDATVLPAPYGREPE
jgi:hypothetical protein